MNKLTHFKIQFKPTSTFDRVVNNSGTTMLIKGDKTIMISDLDQTIYWGFLDILGGESICRIHKDGVHRFVECDEWGSTCVCGVNQK